VWADEHALPSRAELVEPALWLARTAMTEAHGATS
jgi:hypothetical protein